MTACGRFEWTAAMLVAAIFAVPFAARAEQASMQQPSPEAQAPAQASASAQAQTAPESPQLAQAQERLKHVAERLALTPEQKEQVRPVLTDEWQRMKALRDQAQAGNQSRRDRRKMLRELRSIQSDADKKLRGILSDSQMKELQKIREEWRQQVRERAGAR